MTIYISGPITGKPDQNKVAFAVQAQQLSEMGYTVLSPQSLRRDIKTADPALLWSLCMRVCVAALADRADAVFLLPDWIESKGARIEAQLAHDLGIPLVDDVRQLSSVRAEWKRRNAELAKSKKK